MATCLVCNKYSDWKGKFCSYKCGDFAVNNKPELFGPYDDCLIGNCVVCNKIIFTNNSRKYCSPDCQRIAVKLKNKNNREPIPKHIKFTIFSKHDGKCVYCGGEANCIDHVLPVSKGGRTAENNLVAACFQCNIIASGNVFKSIDDKRNYILKKRGIKKLPPIVYMDEDEIFQRPAWHAWVYGGQKH